MQNVRAQSSLRIAICFGLVAITFAVFWQTHSFSFINYDDPPYVTDNAHIKSGLSAENITWAFTHIHSHNWHPLTSISHMLDCQLFGVNPGAHHLVNVVLHSATALLLFLLLESITARVWSSAFVAAVFAIHPLHVESVAWISERKDILSGLFFVLTLIAYARYARQPTVTRYVIMSILFALGLMSKPMLVTLPLILLLLDYWPLQRFEQKTPAKLFVEKIPLFILALGCALITLIVQSKGAIGLVRLDVLPFSWRVTNAFSATLIYIRQMFWPVDLALGYSHPGRLPMWKVLLAAGILAGTTAGFLALRKRNPYLIIGWCWYLVMLLPVIGLIQVGGQAHADRYTYLPQIGLYLAMTWVAVDLFNRTPFRAPALGGLAIVTLLALSACAWKQVGYWRDSETLWRHSLAVTKDNDVAHLGLGMLFSDQKRVNDAITELQTVVDRHPNDADARSKLAAALAEKKDRVNEAIHQYEEAARIGPNPDVETTLANLLLDQGRADDALRYYEHVMELQPSSALAHYNLAVGLHRVGRLSEAIVHYKEALKIQPGYPDADYFLGEALFQNGQRDEAREHLEKR